MRYPAPLPEGGTIGFLAPSFGCAVDPYKTSFLHALDRFRDMGYRVRLGPNCFRSDGYGISSTPQNCAEELNGSFTDPDSCVLLSCGGGEMMCEILPYIDFPRIAASEPKWYMGYSDNTNFTFLSATLADTAAIYGPCASSFGMEPWDQSLQDAFDLLRGEKTVFHEYPLWQKDSLRDEEHPLEPYHLTERARIKKYLPDGPSRRKIRLEGRLMGGCLDCLVNFVGTRFDAVASFNRRYGEDGILWYLEACDLNVIGIRRAIWQLKEAGWFDRCAGFLIGRPLHYGEKIMGMNQYEAVLYHLRSFGVPVLMDLPIGHLPPMMPIVNGAYARVECSGSRLSVAYDFSR